LFNNKHAEKPMSAIEKTEHTCLPPEAYIRLAIKCGGKAPKFKSSYYPQKKEEKQHK